MRYGTERWNYFHLGPHCEKPTPNFSNLYFCSNDIYILFWFDKHRLTPYITEACIFGDVSGPIPQLSETCSELYVDDSDAYLCYNSYRRQFCCETHKLRCDAFIAENNHIESKQLHLDQQYGIIYLVINVWSYIPYLHNKLHHS